MLELLASIGGGFIVGSAINCVREGVRFRPYHSKKARADFERTHKKEIRKMVKSIYWTPDEVKNGPKFWK